MEVGLDVRGPPLVEVEELRDQAPKALLKGASPGEDLGSILKRRGLGDGEDQLPASRHELIERREMLIHGPHRNLGALGDVLPGGAEIS